LKDSDYQYFITLLKEASELFRVDITAYGSICTRMEKRMKEERELEKRITIPKEIIRKKSQAKTCPLSLLVLTVHLWVEAETL